MLTVDRPEAYIISENEFEFKSPKNNLFDIGSFVKVSSSSRIFLGLITEQNIEFIPQEINRVEYLFHQYQGHGFFLGEIINETFLPMSKPNPISDCYISVANIDEINTFISFLNKDKNNIDIAKSRLSSDISIKIDIDQLKKHTFISGQTGSGKSTVMQQIIKKLLGSSGKNKIIIFDLNSDFVDFAIDLQKSGIKKVLIFSNKYNIQEGCTPLKIDLTTMRFEELAEMIKLDMMNDSEKYSREKSQWNGLFELSQINIDALINRLGDHDFKKKLQNLELSKWSIWRTDSTNNSINEIFKNEKEIDDVDFIIIDLGNFNDNRQRNFLNEYILRTIWNNRNFSKKHEENIFLIIDEAHNICPPKSSDPRIQRMTDYLINIAGEGRKYNLNLLLSSQQPSKIHENIISLCNNLVLLKTTSSLDLDFLFSKFSSIPKSFFNEARFFDWCEAIIGGVFTKNVPFFVKFE